MKSIRVDNIILHNTDSTRPVAPQKHYLQIPVTQEVHRSPHSCKSRVHWVDCDRIEYQRLAWLQRALHRDLGRIYRRFIASGLSLTINGSNVEAVDPTLRTTQLDGASAVLAFDELRYELETSSGKTSVVTVLFTMLPVHRWQGLNNVTKRRIGIVGGGGVRSGLASSTIRGPISARIDTPTMSAM